MESNVLVVSVNVALPTSTLESLRQSIINQMEAGVVVLPVYCVPMFVPKDVVVRMEENEK